MKKHPGYKLSRSFRWCIISFKFCRPTRKHPKPGYQVDCPRRSHILFNSRGSRALCCVTKRCDHEDIGSLICSLKFWAIKGLDYAARRDHKNWWPKSNEVPTASQLDAMRVDFRDETDDEEVRARQGVVRKTPKASSKGRRAKAKARPQSTESTDSSSSSSDSNDSSKSSSSSSNSSSSSDSSN